MSQIADNAALSSKIIYAPEKQNVAAVPSVPELNEYYQIDGFLEIQRQIKSLLSREIAAAKREEDGDALKMFVSRLRGDLIDFSGDWDELQDIISERLGKELTALEERLK